jgi:hypothetical protein
VWALVAVLGIAVVVTLTVIALRGPTEYDPSTPEGAAQGYVRAVVSGDFGEAVAHIHERLGCRPTDFRHAWVSDSVAVRLVDTDVAGDTARVELAVSEFDGPFGGGWEHRVDLVMERAADGWLIVEVPWPIYHCEGSSGG